MTREEAIKDIQENIKPFVGGKSLDMAIEALEMQNLCAEMLESAHPVSTDGDLISRADALRELNGACSNWKDDAKVAEIINALPSAEYSKPLQTTLNGGDLISRADAIDALGDEPEVWNDTDAEWAERDSWVLHKVAIESLPSDEAVQGEWIITKEGEYDGRSVYKTVCSECGHETFYKANKAHFCPNCGARMKGGDDE